MRATSILFHVLVWLGLSGITGWCWIVSARAPRRTPASLGVISLEERVYRTVDDYQATLEVYRPLDASPAPLGLLRPAVLAIHGGSWTGGSKRLLGSDPESTIIRLARAGLVVVAVEYRLARPGCSSWPGALDDLREAVRWTRRHSQELGIDPDRIAALGQSSGAHLAALLGTVPDSADGGDVSSRVQAVVSFYGPSDLNRLTTIRHLTHDPTRIFLGDGKARFHDLATEASPLRHVTRDDPPMLLLHGTDDAWVPIEQSASLAEALQRAGIMQQLIVVEGARHGFEARVKYPVERDLLPEILAFLKRVWNARSE